MTQEEMDPEKEERELVEWFRTDLLPKIVEDGHLPTGKNPKIKECKFQITERFTDHFASSPYFLHLVVDSDDGESKFDLLVKFAVQDNSAAELMHVDRQFCNEVVMYNHVLDEFRSLLRKNPKAPQDLVDELVPKCYYARFDNQNPNKSVLVFQNLKTFEFRSAESKVYLDFEHCAIGFRKLGKFHALSLALKIRYPEILEKLAHIFTECRYFDHPIVLENCNVFHRKCNQRAIDYLLGLDSPQVPQEYLVNFGNLLSHPYELMVDVLKPKEPLALICHGDFCRNNILFRYDDDHVVDAKVFDFQTPRYASPAIDLTFFMYLNTTQELREQHFDELLTIYYSTLVSTTSSILDIPENEVSNRYPFKLFMDEFARHAVYAYFQVAFFQPVMSEKCEMDFSESLENQAQRLYTVGGEKVSKSIADVILDFYKRKFYVSALS